jgi:hypothetical protein
MNTWAPELDYPGITFDRLLVVGDIIRTSRASACDDHRPERWETNWSLGVRQFERMNGDLNWASKDYPWLRVIAGFGGGPVQFVFTIGDQAIRVCRGDAEEIAERYQEPTFPELVQQQILVALDKTSPTGRFLRIAVENDAHGAPEHIYLVEVDEETGKPIRSFLIPALAATTTVTDFAPPVPPVDIPPVSAEPIENEDEQQQNNSKKKTGSDDE